MFTRLTSIILGSAVLALSQEAPKPSLLPTVKTVRAVYCSGDLQVLTLLMHFRIRLSNVGRATLLLYRQVPQATATWMGVGLSPADSKEKRWISETTPLITTNIDLIVQRFSNRSFVRLNRGDSHEVDVGLAVPVLRGAEVVNGVLPSGTYWLSFSFPTWPDAAESPSAVASQFAQRGKLWSDNVMVGPVPFTVDRAPVVRDCQN